MDRLTFPLPARGIWLRVRSLLEPARERLGPEAGPWKIGGGTVLAARWNHRESTDRGPARNVDGVQERLAQAIAILQSA